MILFADSGTVTVVVLGMLALVIGWLLLRSHRYFSRQRRDRSTIVRTTRLVRQSAGHNLDAPAEVLGWEVEMHETARALAGELDSKMGALQALIAQADRAAARLEAALDPSRQTQPSRQAQPSRQTQSNQQTLPSQETQPSDQAQALKSPATATGAAAQPAGGRRREEIHMLADYGFDSAEIARRVGSPIGEVELILGLREKT
ncbi:MAG TPA: hypothetical protein VMY42_12625 [Thermoguttaceae bacterium]|nr:hypothetical protein [Thermoguttaceae bacterium]